jgi:hypothetical protein
LLQLGRVAEVIARRYVPETGVHILEQNLSTRREEKPEDALYNGIERLTRFFADNGRKLPHSVLFTVDALDICTRAFLSVRQLDEAAAAYAANYVGIIGDIALTAAKTRQGRPLYTAVYRLGDLLASPNFLTQESPARVLALTIFEAGIVAEMNSQEIVFQDFGDIDEVLERIVKTICGCPKDAIQNAITARYRRGGTMYVPDATQETFKSRIDQLAGTVFLGRDGLP